MLSTILASRAQALLVLGLLLVGFGPARPPVVAQPLRSPIDTDQDWRQALVGRWDCRGVNTLGGKGKAPYMGILNNQWVPGRPWLRLDFAEQRAQGKPMQEQQLWEATSADGTHRRTLLTNDGIWGVVTSPGPQGNVMRWEGSFGDMALSETITWISANKHRWYGELTRGTEHIGYYQLTCTRIASQS
ncbi:MAG TPA: hypothetical protein VGD69_23585 [Herpetosiphonaceae bacterium]